MTERKVSHSVELKPEVPVRHILSRTLTGCSHFHVILMVSESYIHRISPLSDPMEPSGELDLEGIDDQEIEKVRLEDVYLENGHSGGVC